MTTQNLEANSTSQSWMYPKGPVFIKGQGVWLWDEKGERYFDGTGGSGALNLGHSHSEVNSAIIQQIDKITHTGCKVQSSIRQKFIKRLVEFFPLSGVKVLPTVTGAETVEAAIKVARAYTGKSKIMAFERSYHGKTTGALSLTWNASIKKYSPIDREQVVHCSAPVLVEQHQEISVESCLYSCEKLLKENEENKTPIAALIIEPIQATEGVLELTEAFLVGIQGLAKKYGALFIIDEIYTGFGRTGKPFYFQYFDLNPDIVLVGKALANGLPIGAVLGSEKIIDALPSGIQTSTFSGHPLASAAAIATLEVIESKKLWKHAEQLGNYIRKKLDEIHLLYGGISKSRGIGLMIGFDCINQEGALCEETTLKFVKECLQNKILFFKGGYLGTSIRLTPSLLVTEEEADVLLEVVKEYCLRLHVSTQKERKYVV
jgi:4-aminobutyrate aminotransferase/(S)-3-amino-2-methylpropionate transaminase